MTSDSTSPVPQRCPACGGWVPAGLSLWLCPSCCLSQAAAAAADEAANFEEEHENALGDILPPQESTAPPHEAPDLGMRFGRYTLLAEIGRGGMGIVYRARQERLGRIVALKVLPGSPILTEEWRRRFELEATSAGQLNHPHVVKIIESGEYLGQLFIAMEWIDGPTLANRLQHGPLEPVLAAQLLSQLAEAVTHAHQHDVVHRDLKPSNVILTPAGEAVLVDFGLARPMAGSQAATQLLMGSPHYMPPERLGATHSQIGTPQAEDIYGLGAVLYHCLTGIPPHGGENLAAVLASMAEQDPVPPRVVRRQLPRDLETICLKCLERRPEARYASAEEVKADLQRFLRDEPTLARPLNPIFRLGRWCRRHVALSILSLSLLLVTAGGTTLSLLGWRGARQQAALALTSNETLRRQAYASDLAAASAAFDEGNLPLGRLLLQRQLPLPGQSDLRGFEWYYLSDQLRPSHVNNLSAHPHIVRALAWHPSGQRLLSIGFDGTVRDWAWEEATGTLTPRTPHLLSSGVQQYSLAWLPDGSAYLLGGEQGVSLREADDSHELWNLPGRVFTLRADGRNLAVSTALPDYYLPPGKITYYQLAGPVPPRRLQELSGPRRQSGLSDDGHWLATTLADNVADRSDRTIEVLNLADPTASPLTLAIPSQVSRLCFSPAGDVLAVSTRQGHDGVVRFSLPSGSPMPDLLPQTPNIYAMQYLADPPCLLVGSSDRSLTTIQPDSGETLRLAHAHENEVWATAIHPSKKWLASGDKDGSIRIFHFPLQPLQRLTIPAEPYHLPIFSPDSSALLSHHQSSPGMAATTLRYDLGTTQTITPLPGGKPIGYAADGSLLIWNQSTNTLDFWPPGASTFTRRSAPPLPLSDRGANVFRRCITRNGRFASLLFYSGAVSWIDLTTGQANLIEGVFERNSNGIALSEDGRFLVVVDWTNCFIHDTVTHLTTRRDNSRHWAKAVDFSADGRFLASPGISGKIEILSVPSFVLLTILSGHQEEASFARFTPDSRTLISSETGEGLRFWSTDQWRQLLHLPIPQIFQFQIAPDGQSLAVEILSKTDRHVTAKHAVVAAPRTASFAP